jgi:alpha-tubulin suppressor-like RCC1 family protein
MDCGLLRVMNASEFLFSCEPCSVWATGKGKSGQLGNGANTNLLKFTKVYTICVDSAISFEYTSLLNANKTAYWSGKS